MLWLILCVVCSAALLTIAICSEGCEHQREIRRAVWPWARDYYVLRDGRDDELPQR